MSESVSQLSKRMSRLSCVPLALISISEQNNTTQLGCEAQNSQTSAQSSVSKLTSQGSDLGLINTTSIKPIKSKPYCIPTVITAMTTTANKAHHSHSHNQKPGRRAIIIRAGPGPV